jgi:hypothetical protein
MAVPHRFLAISLLLVCVLAPGIGHAYSGPEGFLDGAYEGGGDGRWFTGSPADGFSCSVCHLKTNTVRQFPLYVAGVPAAYAPATPQKIVMAWPEFAQRWTELRPVPGVAPMPPQPAPTVGLVAELVAESGKASGTIEIASPDVSDPSELCERAQANLKPRVGVRLFQVRPNLEARQIRANDDGVLRCEANQLGQRCVIALLACGSKQLSFTWTPPATREGPIWFSAGFVATDALANTPDLDSVQEVAMPIVPAGTAATYEETLRSGCTLAPGTRLPGAGAVAAIGTALGLLGRRTRRRGRP